MCPILLPPHSYLDFLEPLLLLQSTLSLTINRDSEAKIRKKDLLDFLTKWMLKVRKNLV